MIDVFCYRIEHLVPSILSKVPLNIFGRIQPKLAIFSTPNSEYNFLFDAMKSNGFRHDDHKFEWTRQEFREWAFNICKEYPYYRVAFLGIGLTPSESLTCGEASQMAIFVRMDIFQKYSLQKKSRETQTSTNNGDQINGLKRNRGGAETIDNGVAEPKRLCLEHITPTCPNYQEILAIDYPVDDDPRTREEKILTEIVYYINAKCDLRRYYNYSRNVYIISWIYILDRIAKYHVDKKELLDILSDNNYEVEGDYIIVAKDDDEWESYSDFEMSGRAPDLQDDDVYSEFSSDEEKISLD